MPARRHEAHLWSQTVNSHLLIHLLESKSILSAATVGAPQRADLGHVWACGKLSSLIGTPLQYANGVSVHMLTPKRFCQYRRTELVRLRWR